MKVIVNFGEKKVVVPCGTNGDLSIRELIHLATTKYCKLSAYNNNVSNINSDQVQLRLNNGAVVDPDDRVCDVVDDREELFASMESHPINFHTNGDLSSSLTSSNISTSLSEQERSNVLPSSTNRHEVIVTDADLRTQSLRIKTESTNTQQQNVINRNCQRHSPSISLSNNKGMYKIHYDEKTGDKIFNISLPKENTPLGIHVIPYNSNEEYVHGLVLQNIESDGRIQRQGILQINDRIIEINQINIEQCSFEKAQLIFRNALLEPELELKIIRNTSKSSSFYLNNNKTELNQNAKRLGKIIKITLKKGNDGLGFKLASRDNPAGAANPIYVKTIFPKGAAIEDGRLKIGDRLLTVNSIDVTQMSLQETVGLLRETRIGETIYLCISRQNDGSLPKDLINDQIKTQIMTFDIPLRDTSSAGLGITLKGKTSIIDGQTMDLGIFVKSILTGGAAYRDNRLRSNDQILIINESPLINMTNLEAAAILHDAVRKEIQPGFIKITISRVLNDEQNTNLKHVKETELSSPLLTINNDENELDLTNFVSSVHLKPPMKSNNLNDSEIRSTVNQSPMKYKPKLNEKENQEETSENENPNPFERETPFRQSISEKRRLNQHANNQVLQWKQQSFHENRTNSERRQPTRPQQDLSSNLIRSTSYESIHKSNENCDRQQQTKLRGRACNDSFRQAVDKSYCHDSTNEDKLNKNEKQKFKFSNLFTTKSKRKDQQDEKSLSNQRIKSSSHNNQAIIYPPPPAPFSSRQEKTSIRLENNERLSTGLTYPLNNQQQGYQPHRFNSNKIVHNQEIPPTHYDSHIMPGKSSLVMNSSKMSHPPIPREFLQSNVNGSQSLKQHQTTSRSPFPSIFNVQSNHLTSHQIKRTDHQLEMLNNNNNNNNIKFENPANV